MSLTQLNNLSHRKYYSSSRKVTARAKRVAQSIPSSRPSVNSPRILHRTSSGHGKIRSTLKEGAIFGKIMFEHFRGTFKSIEQMKEIERSSMKTGERRVIVFETNSGKATKLYSYDPAKPQLQSNSPNRQWTTVVKRKNTQPMRVSQAKKNPPAQRKVPQRSSRPRRENYSERWERNFHRETGIRADYLGPDTRFDRFERGQRMS